MAHFLIKTQLCPVHVLHNDKEKKLLSTFNFDNVSFSHELEPLISGS